MPARDMPLTSHLAGWDKKLRVALEDLQLDRWLAAKELLRDTGTDWALRTSRSQALAVGAAKYGAIEAWCAEEPYDWDALMMRARVQTQRVLNAHRDGLSGRKLISAVRDARAACETAAERWPKDPVPHVCRLALVQVDTDPRFPHSRMHWEARDDMLPPGPWRLLSWVDRLDRYNREAYHRMLHVLYARDEHALYFTQTVASFVPDGSALKALPLYAFVESYRRQRQQKQTASVLAYWTTEDKAHYARRALHDWFEAEPPENEPRELSLLDLNYLAHALTATGEGNAAAVFEAIGPYVTAAPWVHVTEKSEWWQDDFRSARAKALGSGRRW